MLIVVSKVKDMAKAVDLRTSLEFCTALSEVVAKIVIRAAKSAKADGRGTIKVRDLPTITFEENYNGDE